MAKNIFDYATKELSQDAFLMWLFDSWEYGGEVRLAAENLLNKFGIKEKIKEIKVEGQKDKIDVTVYITTTENNYGLYIEDKTASSVNGNQLIRYNKSIEKQKNDKSLDKVVKIYYKAFLESKDDEEGIKKANENIDDIWTAFYISKIAGFWKDYVKADNLILRSYAKHISAINDELSKTKKRPENAEKENFNKWIGYFNYLKNYVNDNVFDCKWDIYRKHFVQIVIRLKNIDAELRGVESPCLEIRNNECCDGYFQATIQLPKLRVEKVDDKNKIKQKIKEEIKKHIGEDSFFVFTGNQNQVCRAKIKVNNDKEFKDQFKKSLEEFKKLFERIYG